jgi:hypothetical protein
MSREKEPFELIKFDKNIPKFLKLLSYGGKVNSLYSISASSYKIASRDILKDKYMEKFRKIYFNSDL